MEKCFTQGDEMQRQLAWRLNWSVVSVGGRAAPFIRSSPLILMLLARWMFFITGPLTLAFSRGRFHAGLPPSPHLCRTNTQWANNIPVKNLWLRSSLHLWPDFFSWIILCSLHSLTQPDSVQTWRHFTNLHVNKSRAATLFNPSQ